MKKYERMIVTKCEKKEKKNKIKIIINCNNNVHREMKNM